ncbi:hypothetical protein P170DRAFT_513098 [Aspergillus steynii IBT 23096]|uniref:Aminoglycoside phosphotransferase domain-containing protein n=1 Tax=Aspergillus steynii IBT 23096 TaxID=1392250 RepID=A0A2I2FWI9_9EURO|nr:uncharacterized protein P170DRAFT_513098 [Aspergillus steynii IBT 23096]PLB45009.1 hypothetical protein P170DRAFT_513098 [Aspergillus steynii IBT 23096]
MIGKIIPSVKQQRRLDPHGRLKFQLRSFHTDWNANVDFFRYTRGRFVSNEEHEMAIRHVRFNMTELARLAAESVGCSLAQCARIEKFPDGMFNKCFLFIMQDGREVVGKVPNPNAGRAHYTTASEVATMDFVRNELCTPVPKVLAWSSRANKTPVGAEYIIMEKVAGVQLNELWPKLDIRDKFAVVKAITGFQKAWMSTSFTPYGSLYYASDLGSNDSCILVKPNGSEVKEHRFAVGPSTGREFLDDGRIALDFDRGPWNSAEQYKLAVGLREIFCVREMDQLPRSPLSLYGPGTYSPSRPKKIAALQNYLRLVKYLLPLERSFSSVCLWHPDLHAENIFVNPKKPSEVLGIIDWQSCEVLPLFDHARQPYFLDYDGPLTGLDPPTFPENFDQLDAAEQAAAQSLYLQMSLSALYRRFLFTNNKPLFDAMEFRWSTSFELMLLAQNLLVDGGALYRSRLLDLEKEWPSLPGVQAAGIPSIPFHFCTDEANLIEQDAAGAIKAMELMQRLKRSLGQLWPEKGVVQPDQHDEVKNHLNKAKMEIFDRLALSHADQTAWNKSWPFDG